MIALLKEYSDCFA
jgi:hypothetical protein